MKFSILIPSRGRPGQLETLLESIKERTARIHNVDVWIALDLDDPYHQQYLDIPGHTVSYHVHHTRRKECFPEYYNDLAYLSKGDVLWTLNDDCVIATDRWDEMVRHKIGDHTIWYGDVGDSTRNFNNNGEYSCFPMMSREAFNTLGYFFNPKNKTHGTDKFLKMVFEKAGAPIINLLDIHVEHQHILNDDTSRELYAKFGVHIGQEYSIDYEPEIERLRKAVGK